MKKIPFNLERALAGDKVVTRDGSEVTQIHLFDASETTYPLLGVVSDSIASWTTSGICVKGETSDRDLFMAPKTVKRWVNFYAQGEAFYYICEHDAIKNASRDAIAIAVPVEFEEGYGCEKAD